MIKSNLHSLVKNNLIGLLYGVLLFYFKKEQIMSKNNRYSCHHLIPSSKDIGDGATKQWINKKYIDDRLHIRHHALMDNKTPIEQLMYVLIFNEQILSDKFVKELLKVLDKYIYNYYKVNTKIQSELWWLLTLEQEYFKH